MKKYTLTNGRQIEVFEVEMEGMAGESMTILQVANSAKEIVRFKDIMHLLSLKDRTEITKWIKYLRNCNHAAAVAFCI